MSLNNNIENFYNEIIELLEIYIHDNNITSEEREELITKYENIRQTYGDIFKGLKTKNYAMLLPDLDDKIRIEDININTVMIDLLIKHQYDLLESKMDVSGGTFNGDVNVSDFKPKEQKKDGIYPKEMTKLNSKSKVVSAKTMQHYLEHLLSVDIIEEKVTYYGIIMGGTNRGNKNEYKVTNDTNLYFIRKTNLSNNTTTTSEYFKNDLILEEEVNLNG